MLKLHRANSQAFFTARALLSECRARRHGLGFWFVFRAARRAPMRASGSAPLPAPRAPHPRRAPPQRRRGPLGRERMPGDQEVR